MSAILNLQIRFCIECRIASQGDAAFFYVAIEFASPFRGLVGDEVGFAEFGCHDGDDVAMAAAADRVFRDGEFRRKGPADRVVFAAFGRDVAEQAVELFEFGHVRLAVDDVSFVGQDADQVAGEVGFDGADAQGFFHGVCDRDGFHVIGREIHGEAGAVTGDDQFAAEGLEDVAAGVGFDEMGQDISRPQGRMAAEVDFTARRKPAQVPVIAFFDGKGRFG